MRYLPSVSFWVQTPSVAHTDAQSLLQFCSILCATMTAHRLLHGCRRRWFCFWMDSGLVMTSFSSSCVSEPCKVMLYAMECLQLKLPTFLLQGDVVICNISQFISILLICYTFVILIHKALCTSFGLQHSLNYSKSEYVCISEYQR